MKVLAINLRPDSTQIVEGEIKKGCLIVEHADSCDSIYEILDTFQQESAEDFFEILLSHVKNKTAPAYFGISDCLIKKIDCFERDYVPPHEWGNMVSSWLPQALQLDKENFYINAPLHLEKKNKSVVTGVAIASAYINLIFEAAVTARIKIKSIEPACFALLRLINKWDKECCIMEVWANTTSLTGYSPIRGMFKINQSMGWLSYLSENGEEEFANCIVNHDFVAYNTYKLANTDIPIYLVSDHFLHLKKLTENSEFASRINDVSELPDNRVEIKAKAISTGKVLPVFASTVGLALNPLYKGVFDNADSSG